MQLFSPQIQYYNTDTYTHMHTHRHIHTYTHIRAVGRYLRLVQLGGAVGMLHRGLHCTCHTSTYEPAHARTHMRTHTHMHTYIICTHTLTLLNTLASAPTKPTLSESNTMHRAPHSGFFGGSCSGGNTGLAIQRAERPSTTPLIVCGSS